MTWTDEAGVTHVDESPGLFALCGAAIPTGGRPSWVAKDRVVTCLFCLADDNVLARFEAALYDMSRRGIRFDSLGNPWHVPI